VDRLIGAANMFDILPRSAVPRDVELPRDLQEAKQQCRGIFRSLPDSYERSSILNALGRIGMASLKHKTRHRAQYLVPTLEEWFPEIVRVLDAAIDCRNHYVHGSPSRIDYSENNDMVIFFTHTLEFVFGASELVEAGLDIQAFVERPTSMSHPYGAYRVNYPLNLQAFRALVERS
jgi:ApeA N-terminal domain 1